MASKLLPELLHELDEALRSGAPIDAEDRVLLERIQRELALALHSAPSPSAPPALGRNLREAVGRVQADHPRLSALLSAALDALSDLGV